MTRIDEHTTREELAAIVCGALDQLPDPAVLVGGSVVSIYTEGRYVSDDLDFVTWREERKHKPIMEALGFSRQGSYWMHPATRYFVQFVGSPVMVGHKYISRYERWETAAGPIRLLSPLDSVLDRFAWHLSQGDAETLEQAIDIAVLHEVALGEVKQWLKSEPWPAALKERAFAELTRRVEQRRRQDGVSAGEG